MKDFAKDTYCGFHTCVWAHNLGFNISTNYCYDPKYDVEHLYKYSEEYSCSTKERMDRMITAMTQTTLMGWLQETFNVHVEIYCNAMGWGWLLTKLNGTTLLEIEDDMFFDSYKEALEVGLTKAMDIITLNGGKNLMLIPASQIHR